MSKVLLQTNDLGITFGGLKAVQGINLTINEKELCGLIGPNGAGKTTVFNLLTGVYKPTTGSFSLDGQVLSGKKQEIINRKGIARTFQNIRLFNNMTVISNVMVGLHNLPEFKCSPFTSMFRLPRHFSNEKKMRQRAKELLEIFGLLEERNVLACNLPYGKQRKLEIARALATNPKLLLLDEPAAGMNPTETAELLECIKIIREKFGIAILLIEHDMSLVMNICEKIMVIDYGQTIAWGGPEEIASNKRVIEAYLGKDDEDEQTGGDK